MGNTDGEKELLFLTDQHGNAYVMPSETIAHARVSKEHQAQVKELVTAETSGYGNYDWLKKGIFDHWGWIHSDPKYGKLWEAENVGNFDLDGDGKIGDGDVAILLKGGSEPIPPK
jgi:hypothetical protein